jgi:hypothetical protein
MEIATIVANAHDKFVIKEIETLNNEAQLINGKSHSSNDIDAFLESVIQAPVYRRAAATPLLLKLLSCQCKGCTKEVKKLLSTALALPFELFPRTLSLLGNL